MAHNLFGERFYSLRQPAWHGLGKVMDRELGAVDAFTAIGAYDVRLVDLRTVDGLPVAHRAVVRCATPDDPQERVLSVVSQDYNIVTPAQVVVAWDDMIKAPVETIGALGKGETIFVTTKMPTLSVGGDEIENYLILAAPMTGTDAIWVRVSPVRVVCKNTLTASRSAATEQHRILHDSNAEHHMRLWMEHVYTKATTKMNDLHDTFEAMAKHDVNTAEVDNVLELVYTMPKLPRRGEMPEPIYIQRREQFEYQKERAERRRGAVLDLFAGKGRGSDSPAARGTAWGLYNAVVEFEDYCGNGQGRAVAESALVGDRARNKAAAFDACAALLN